MRNRSVVALFDFSNQSVYLLRLEFISPSLEFDNAIAGHSDSSDFIDRVFGCDAALFSAFLETQNPSHP